MSDTNDPSLGQPDSSSPRNHGGSESPAVRPRLEDCSEQELAAFFGRGSADEVGQALGQLLDRHAFVLRRDSLVLSSGHQTDADDLLGVFRLHLLEKHDKYDPEHGSWLPWARAVLRGCASAERRKKQAYERRVQTDEDGVRLSAGANRPPWMDAMKKEMSRDLRDCLQLLNGKLQRVFVLRVCCGHTFQQVSNLLELGTSPRPARLLAEKARKQLESCLRKKGYDSEDLD